MERRLFVIMTIGASLAVLFGLALVAEGIETAEQLECLRKLNCECGQGFYFSPPVSAESCRAMLWQLRGPLIDYASIKFRQGCNAARAFAVQILVSGIAKVRPKLARR